jgi:hypothetical protein
MEGLVDETMTKILQHGEDQGRDVVALLAHLIMFSPRVVWPRVAAFGFSLVEAVLLNLEKCEEREVYMAASVLATLSQRLEAGMSTTGFPEFQQSCQRDVRLIQRLADRLQQCWDGEGDGEDAPRIPPISAFVNCRVQVALERSSRVQAIQPTESVAA